MEKSSRVIVAVDDEPDNLDLVARTLSKYTVHKFTDPDKALAEIVAIDPAALIVDYRMPQMTGVEFIRRCREIGISCAVVMVTAFRELDEVAFAQQQKLIYQVVPKPFEPSRLRDWTDLAVVQSKTGG